MVEPTKAVLQTQLAAAQTRLAIVEKERDRIDSEARAYAACVDALGNLTKSGSYASSGRSPDVAAIGRVLESLRSRFGLNDLDSPGVDNYFMPEIESQDDPRDTVIAQLIDALRKS